MSLFVFVDGVEIGTYGCLNPLEAFEVIDEIVVITGVLRG